MRSEDNDPAAECPVDHRTREKWMEAARANGQSGNAHPRTSGQTSASPQSIPLRYSLDHGRWLLVAGSSPRSTPVTEQRRPKLYRLDTSREISTIPRALPSSDQDKGLNAAERAALPPANNETDTGQDRSSGNWVYPSQEMFFNAMRRKGHAAEPADMTSIVPIHNAVNERAWKEIKEWERRRGADACGGPKLISFAGDSKSLTPKARWNALLGYQPPFDRHDWVIDRCGKHIDYVIDFYSGKNEGITGKSLNFYLDVRPKLNSWEGVKMRVLGMFGW